MSLGLFAEQHIFTLSFDSESEQMKQIWNLLSEIYGTNAGTTRLRTLLVLLFLLFLGNQWTFFTNLYFYSPPVISRGCYCCGWCLCWSQCADTNSLLVLLHNPSLCPVGPSTGTPWQFSSSQNTVFLKRVKSFWAFPNLTTSSITGTSWPSRPLELSEILPKGEFSKKAWFQMKKHDLKHKTCFCF